MMSEYLTIIILASSSSLLNILISLFIDSTVPEESSLIEALFLMSFTLYANFKVLNVSEKHVLAGEMFPIREVLEFPPKESLSKKVNLESL